jgi:predicted nucleotidyltransferase
MQRRLNITLSEDLLARADAFARRERYTRSALIAAALDAFVERDPRMLEAISPMAVGPNPAGDSLIPEIIDVCRSNGVTYAALVGSSTRPDPAIKPRDLTIMVRFDAEHSQKVQYRLIVQGGIECFVGRTVVVIDARDPGNARRVAEFEPTKLVLFDDESDA